MTDEEISEFAECLEDACREAVARDWRVVPLGQPYGANCCCPLGAMFGRKYPDPIDVAYYGLNTADLRSFMNGFDGHADNAYPLRVLGTQFRERALAGEWMT